MPENENVTAAAEGTSDPTRLDFDEPMTTIRHPLIADGVDWLEAVDALDLLCNAVSYNYSDQLLDKLQGKEPRDMVPTATALYEIVDLARGMLLEVPADERRAAREYYENGSKIFGILTGRKSSTRNAADDMVEKLMAAVEEAREKGVKVNLGIFSKDGQD